MKNDEAATIFVRKNADKTQEKHPTHKISVIVKQDIPAGSKLYGALWPKVGDDGTQYYAGQIEFPQERGSAAPPRQQPRRNVEDTF